jgi:hypothetical protein
MIQCTLRRILQNRSIIRSIIQVLLNCPRRRQLSFHILTGILKNFRWWVPERGVLLADRFSGNQIFGSQTSGGYYEGKWIAADLSVVG